MRALLVVDIQNDFCEGGALGVAGGTRVAQSVSRYIAEHGSEYAVIVASRDWPLIKPTKSSTLTLPSPSISNKE